MATSSTRRTASTAATAAGSGSRAGKGKPSPLSKQKGGAKAKKKVVGRKKYKYECSFDGCSTQARVGGVCVRHGAKVKPPKLCKEEGCANQAQRGGLCVKHGAKVKQCSKEGCTNQAQNGGVCMRHGAKIKRKLCKEKGCTNQVIKGGVCVTHGAKVKQCSKEGCTNQAQNGGVCITHGAKVKQCSKEGCTNQAKQGGVCFRHGAKVKHKVCSEEGCTNQAINGGVCQKHGAKVRQCSEEGCTNQARVGGVCVTHGAKVKPPKLCKEEGCTTYAKRGGVCQKHGAIVKQCSKEGCTNQAREGGVCWRHGAKAKVRRCSKEGCTKFPVKGGVCVTHGANKRTSPNKVNQEGDETIQSLPESKRRRTSAKSKRTRTNSSQTTPAKTSKLQSQQIARKRRAARRDKINSDQVHGINKTKSPKRRRKTNADAALDAAETLLSFSSGGSTAFDTGDSTHHDDDNIDAFQFDDSETAGTEPQVLAVEVNLESLPQALWDDSSLSMSPSISKFLTIEEVKNVRLVSKVLHLQNPVKRARLRVASASQQNEQLRSTSSGIKFTRLFLERTRAFLDPTKELFNRLEVEFVGSSFITSCRNFRNNMSGKEQGFFQYTNCLSRVKGLTLKDPDDFTILHSLGELLSLEQLCFRHCFPYKPSRRRMYLKSSYAPQDYGRALKNVGYIELTKSSLPRQLLNDLFKAAPKLKMLKIRRCRDADTFASCDDFLDALSTLTDLEEFKFVPDDVLVPSATVVPTENDYARAGLGFIHREQAARDEVAHIHRSNEVMDLLPDDVPSDSLELVLQNQDEYTRLSTRLLLRVCNSQNGSLKSLSMRNVELFQGVGIEPLRRLKCIEKICLCAMSSFEAYHLQLLHDVGRETLRKLSLVHCRLIEGHLGRLIGLKMLEELSLHSTFLCDDDITSLSNMRKLKVLNVFGQIQHDCDISPLRVSGNLRHLSLQIFNKVKPDIAQQMNGMVSLQSLCLRIRFLGVHEMDTEDDVPFIPIKVDEESTLNLSVGVRTDASVADETILDDDEIQEDALMEYTAFNFSGLFNLRSLLIYDSVLTDELVESISGLHQLRELSLWNCQDLSEASISHLSNLKSLEKLCLHRFNAISEAGLETLSSSLVSVKELELYQCGIMHDVEIDNNLGTMKRLRKLTISPYRLEKPTHLTHIQLVKDESERNATKRVDYLLQKIGTKGMF